MNEKNVFTCIGKGHGAPCLPATREDWEKLRREPWLKQMCERIERGDEQLKHRLPVWTPHCAEFKNNHRAIADAVRPLNRLMLDFDEKGHTDEICARLLDKSPLVPLLIEESVRRGTHVLVELPEGMTAEQAQQLMKEATGFLPDAAVKDVSRCIYMVTEEHTKYVSDKLWTPGLTTTGLTPDPSPNGEGSGHLQDEGTGTAAATATTAVQSIILPSPFGEGSGVRLSGERGGGPGLLFKGIPYASIIAEWWRRTGGEPQTGERNVKLYQLAVNLRAICDNKKEVLLQVMPRFGLSDAEMRSVIDSACKEPPKGISKLLASIIENERLKVKSEELSSGNDGADDPQDISRPSPFGEGTGMRLPIGLKESLKGVPPSMHMPVLCSVLPIAAAYADQVEVEYCDGQRQHLGLMSIIRGEQASGKSVCKNAVDVWKRQFDEEDALARRREEVWKERKKSRKASEKAPEDPHVLIRMVPVTVSCSTLLKRFKNAANHTLYSFGEELDTLRKTNGAGSWSSKYDIYRLSFDRGEWGQDYNSDQAESGVVKVAYNWTMLGTDGALRKCFKQDNIENGLSSRILVSEMPDSSFSKMPRFGRRSAEDEARIQEAVTRLRSVSGFVDTPRLRKAIDEWVEQKRVEAAKDIDHVKDVYRKRAAVIGFRCGVIHHLLRTSSPLPLHGESGHPQGLASSPKRTASSLTGKVRGGSSESKSSVDFALMMAEYALSQQIAAFGEALQAQYVEASGECQRYGSNHSVFDQLAPSFTLDDLRALKRGSCSDASLRKIISRWYRDKWIEKTDKGRWRKVESGK